jgi:3-deoxy-7-phosphoheptulonate synthase
MIVVMQTDAAPEQIDHVEERLTSFGYKVYRSGEQQMVLGAVGAPQRDVDPRDIEILPGVREVIRIARPFKLVNRAFRPEGSIVNVSGVKIGGGEVVVIAGPCAVESRDQVRAGAAAVRAAGAQILRGGAFKPRTSPYAFQGLGEEGLRYLREAADEQHMPCVTEVIDTNDVELVEKYADMLQVGARNMQNFRLLARLGATSKPILLKRGISATLEELLMAAEYIAAAGNSQVVLCERGIRTFEPWTRNTMDVSAIPVLRKVTHLPIIVDPSHATGIRDHVIPMARAAIAAGADGVIVEVHPDPDTARCDGAQSLAPNDFQTMMADMRIIAPAVRRRPPAQSRSFRKPFDKPLFKRAAILGVGLIGGSLALSLKETRAVEHIIGVAREGSIDTVRKASVVDEVFSINNIDEALKNADLVILASPVQTILDTVGWIGKHLKKGALVTDVGGTKEVICAAALKLPKGVFFIGGHPMAGSERRGPTAADPTLFQDAVYALCPVGDVPEDLINKLSLALKSIGSNPIILDPARHDRLAAAISHVPYLLSVALTNSAGRMDDELTLRFAAGGFRDMTRIASSPYRSWNDVLATNQGPIRAQLSAVRKALDTIEASLTIEDKLKPEIEDAARYRLNIPRNLQGIQRPDNELIVRIVDEPGALSSVTTSLAREKINICDIQVLKVRHDEDGVLRLAFLDRPTTLRAVDVLRQAGHYVRLRGE